MREDITDWLINRENSIGKLFECEGRINKMKCTDKEQETCNVEKLGCKGCYYSTENSIKELEKEIANKLDDEQWDNWQEVLKYIKELQERNNT